MTDYTNTATSSDVDEEYPRFPERSWSAGQWDDTPSNFPNGSIGDHSE